MRRPKETGSNLVDVFNMLAYLKAKPKKKYRKGEWRFDPIEVGYVKVK